MAGLKSRLLADSTTVPERGSHLLERSCAVPVADASLVEGVKSWSSSDCLRSERTGPSNSSTHYLRLVG